MRSSTSSNLILFPIAILIGFLFLLPETLAATLHGTLYDLDLSMVKSAVIEVNTSPLQRSVAANGTYSFTIPPGNYMILGFANKDGETLQTNEVITVLADGDYTLDLFLLPQADLNVSDLEGLDGDLAALAGYNEEKNQTRTPIGVAILAICIGLYLIWHNRKQKATPSDVDTLEASPKVGTRDVGTPDVSGKDAPEVIIHLLTNAGGRLTQKDLRKHLPYSEAKVSLAIAELESKGKVQKIKKGRGNILILK